MLPTSASPPPLQSPKIPRRVVRAQPNLRLDPHGLSGTPTARRVRNARRKRQIQTVWLSALALTAVVGAATYLGAQLLGISPTHAALPTQKIADLPFLTNSRATWAGDGNLWIQSSDAALWKVSEKGAATKVFTSTFPARPAPLWTGNRVILAAQDGEIAAFNSATGQKSWSRQLESGVSAQPIVARFSNGETALVCGSDRGQIAAFDFASGAPLWKRELGAPVGEGFALAGNRVLIPTLAGQNSRGGLVALDVQSGNMAWRFPAQTQSLAAGICKPFFDAKSGHVFWANDDGAIVALNAQTGARIWKSFAAPLAGDSKTVVLRGCPTVLDGTLVVGGEDGVLRAFNSQNGALLWATPLGSAIGGRVEAASDLSVIARTSDGEAFVVGLSSGEILRRAPFSQSGVWKGKSGFDFTSAGELIKLG